MPREHHKHKRSRSRSRDRSKHYSREKSYGSRKKKARSKSRERPPTSSHKSLRSPSRVEVEKKHYSTHTWNKYAEAYDPIKIASIDGTDDVPHDRAVWRALNSEYLPNKLVKGEPHRTLFVSRLNPKTTQNKIHETFSKFGKIARCRLVKDIVTGKSKCYAFVEYESSKYTQRAYTEMNKTFIDNGEILVDYEMERTLPGWKPRRLGGGFGGKKDSGQLRFGCRDRPFLKPILVDMSRQY